MRMETKRRQQLLLAALIVVLAAAGYRAWTSMTSAVPMPSSNGAGATAPRRAAQQAATAAPDVRLEALDAERPKPGPAERDLFRFKPKPPPAPPNPLPLPPAPVVPSGPPPPPPPPPIPYKFIGKLEGNGQTGRIAVLSDGRGGPLYGREGDIIEGRYRIVRIGAESIEMEHIDGRGRQTIRLGGS
jgi:hypothetical protein